MPSNRRILIAVVLSLIFPGAGHGYLRYWYRAITWFFLGVASVALVITESTLTGPSPGGIEAIVQWSMNLPARVHFAMFVVSVLSAIDATILIVREDARLSANVEEGTKCPHCGGELDAELDFCPWCTTRFDGDSEANTIDGEL